MFDSTHRRDRAPLAAALLLVIAIGFASRRFPDLLPAVLGQYPGDVFWALMVFLWLALLRPQTTSAGLALLAFAIAGVIECSQLYQASWINAVRATFLGRLLLGAAFDWLDIGAYAVGVASGWLLDVGLFHRQRTTPKSAAAPTTPDRR